MKKLLKCLPLLALCLVLCGCVHIQATFADALEDFYGIEGKTYEEHLAIYQKDWDELADAYEKLFNMAAEEAKDYAEEAIEDAIEDALQELATVAPTEEALSSDEKKVQDKLREYIDESKYGEKYDKQCKEFARMVFKDLFGENSYVPSTSGNDYEFNEVSNDSVDKVTTLENTENYSEEEIKDAFSDAKPGDIIQMKRRKSGKPHTAILVSVDDTGMVWLEANADDRGTVAENHYTWSEFQEKNRHFSIYTASDYTLDEG